MHRFHAITRVVAVFGGAALATALTVAPATAHDGGRAPVTVGVQTYNMDFGGDLSHLFAPGADLVTATITVAAPSTYTLQLSTSSARTFSTGLGVRCGTRPASNAQGQCTKCLCCAHCRQTHWSVHLSGKWSKTIMQ